MNIMGYEFVPLGKLLDTIELSRFKKMTAITFDDGFKDLYKNAYPIIREFNIPFTLFLTTSLIDSKELLWLHNLYVSLDRLPSTERESILKGYIECGNKIDNMSDFIGNLIHSQDKKGIKDLVTSVSSAAKINSEEEESIAKNLYLSKKEIEEMKNNGLTVETHGHEHWPLTNLNENETKEEIKSSVRFIEDKLDGSPKYFALPSGTSNKFTKNIVKMLGLKGIATIERKIITEASLDLYSLPRICVYDDMLDFYRVLYKNHAKYIYLKLCKIMKKITNRS
jgi:peptidoglycan/xylan/chitin deacetylase (PgdA/CDA1 family)